MTDWQPAVPPKGDDILALVKWVRDMERDLELLQRLSLPEAPE